MTIGDAAGTPETPATRATAGETAARYAPDLQFVVFALFFVFGGVTSLNDVLIPKLKSLFTLSYGQAMLVQSAFFGAYFLMSIPASYIVRQIGYMRSAAFGLLVMTAGCLIFIPASAGGQFALFLTALFVLAIGITTLQVVANPLISALGPSRTVSSRLTFGQAFNSLGTTLFPYVGSILILGSLAKVDPTTLSGRALAQFRGEETRVIVQTYLGLAAALVLFACIVWLRRDALKEARATPGGILRAFHLLARPRFAFGAGCIFLYVGGEVSVGSLIVNYLMQDSVFGATAVEAGKHVPFYWGGAMVGRFVGAFILRRFSPGRVLAVCAAVVIGLLTVSAVSQGLISGWSLLAIGLFNSIMFPTIFSLASEGLGKRAAEGSGLISMAIVGGAVVPLLTGNAADLWSFKSALVVPAACYAGILAFGLYSHRPVAPIESD